MIQRRGIRHIFAASVGALIIFMFTGAYAGKGSFGGSSYTAPRPAPVYRAPQTVQQKAVQLRQQTPTNSVIVKRGNGNVTRYDLTGRQHFNKQTKVTVPTPHVVQQKTVTNTNPATGQTYSKTVTSQPRPATHGDMRTVQRVLKDRRGNQP